MKNNGTWRNRIVGHGEEAPDQLLANPLNFRVHPKGQQEALAGVLSEVGWVQDVIVNQQTGHVIDGHLRISLAISRNEPTVPVVYVDLNETEEALVLATLDPIAAMAATDKGKLDELLREVSTGEAAVQAMLADLAKASGLDYGAEPKEAPEPQIDKAEELRQKWGTASGQLWTIGRHRLLCGDSTKAEDVARVVEGVGITTICFDPPYDGDATLLNWRYPCQDAIVFTDHRHLFDCVEEWGRFRCLFVWDGQTSWYVQGWPLARCKLALWFGESPYREDGAFYGEPGKPHKATNTRGSYNYKPDPRGKHLSTVFDSPLTREFDGHAHAKPVDWVRMLVGNCTSGDVLDPFAGSGTTLVACEQLGRTCAAIEQQPATAAVVLERLNGMGLEPELCGD